MFPSFVSSSVNVKYVNTLAVSWSPSVCFPVNGKYKTINRHGPMQNRV